MEIDELRVAKVATQLFEGIEDALGLLVGDECKTHLKTVLDNLHQFQSCPHLLDPKLSLFVKMTIDGYGDGQAGTTEVFYNLGKIVGAKKLLNFFPTNVSLLPQLTAKFEHELHWHEEYFLLCWLTVLVLAPFQFDKFSNGLKHELYALGLIQLARSGPLQPLGARLVGSIVMRSDCEDIWLLFMKQIKDSNTNIDPVLKKGLLLAFNVALQKDTHGRVDHQYTTIREFVKGLMNETSNVELTAKIISKFMTNVMNLKDDDWDTIEALINWFQDSFQNKNTDTRFTLANQYGKLITRVDDCIGIDMVLEVLANTKELVSTKSFEAVDSDLLHSHLLCIAELLRRDLIDSHGFSDIITILDKTFFFQQSRITFISGSIIRDASNYIAWSLAKYQKTQLAPDLVMKVFVNLLLVCCFDKEIMLRRSATGAIQELIGRHGVKTWNQFYPQDRSNAAKSIKVIEILDYVDLGSIDKSYFEIPTALLVVFPDLKPKFVEFLVGNVSNVDTDIVKQSSKALKQLIKDDQTTLEEVSSEIISRSGDKPYKAFVALSELAPLLQNKEVLKGIMPKFHAVKINHHKDPPFFVMSYLSLLDALLDIGLAYKVEIYGNVFDAIRMDNRETTAILKSLSTKMALSENQWFKWIHYMKHNNLNTSASVSYLPCFAEKVGEVTALLKSDKIDCNVKASIIRSISDYLFSGKSLQQHELEDVISKLDDYSVSEQGDVGSKVRLATLNLLDVNLASVAGVTGSFLELRLLRLSAEPIDRLRHDSLNLLQRLLEVTEVDTTIRDHRQYFTSLIAFFHRHYIGNKEARTEFLKGYVFTAGALKATDSLITGSLMAFCDFYSSLDSLTKKEILLNLAALIKPVPDLAKRNDYHSQRQSKQILVGMQFYSRILLANIPIPEEFNLEGLFVRVYNLHLGTKNIARLSSAIKIFGYFYAAHGMEKCKDRLLILMTTHQLARVRTLASEEVYMLYTEKFIQTNDVRYQEATRVIESIDWTADSLPQLDDLNLPV